MRQLRDESLIPGKYLLIARSVGLFPQDHCWTHHGSTNAKAAKRDQITRGGCFMSVWSFSLLFSPQERSLLPLPLPFGLLLMRGTHLETLRVVPNNRDIFCWYLYEFQQGFGSHWWRQAQLPESKSSCSNTSVSLEMKKSMSRYVYKYTCTV